MEFGKQQVEEHCIVWVVGQGVCDRLVLKADYLITKRIKQS